MKYLYYKDKCHLESGQSQNRRPLGRRSWALRTHPGLGWQVLAATVGGATGFPAGPGWAAVSTHCIHP
jgi:hypothetical protein